MRAQKWLFTACLLSGMFFIGCSDDDNGGGGDEDNNLKNKTTLNSTAFDKWVYFSFEQGKEVTITDPKQDLGWDMAIHRSDIKLNCGKSGKGKGGAVDAGTQDFRAVTTIPQTGYTTDTEAKIVLKMGATEEVTVYETDGSRNETLSGAITSTGMPPTYKLSNKVYVIKTASGRHLKIKFTSYTNDEGNGGHPAFGYEFLEEKAPVEKQTQTVNAGNFPKWVYFSFEEGKEVTVTDPQNDLSWDIAFHVGDMKLNGGKSGKGAGGAIAITDEALKAAPESGYTADETADILLGMPPSYETDGSKNKVLSSWLKKEGMGYTPTENSLFVVKTASGKYVKIKFTAYAVNENGSMGMAGQGKVPGIFTFEYYYQADGSRDF